jgi:hypothetical protein
VLLLLLVVCVVHTTRRPLKVLPGSVWALLSVTPLLLLLLLLAVTALQQLPMFPPPPHAPARPAHRLMLLCVKPLCVCKGAPCPIFWLIFTPKVAVPGLPFRRQLGRLRPTPPHLLRRHKRARRDVDAGIVCGSGKAARE